jgi:hypothetical protein
VFMELAAEVWHDRLHTTEPEYAGCDSRPLESMG